MARAMKVAIVDDEADMRQSIRMKSQSRSSSLIAADKRASKGFSPGFTWSAGSSGSSW